MIPTADLLDAVVIGGGPAGLSAALVLGRSRRRIALFDGAEPRNRASTAVRGFFSRDGVAPSVLLAEARAQLAPYGVELIEERCHSLKWEDGVFVARGGSGILRRAKKALLATGVRDRLPDLRGAAELWGKSIFSCPYCHGWELRDRRLGVLARASLAADAALGLTTWSDDVVLFTDGETLEAGARAKLERQDIGVHEAKIASLAVDGDRLHGIVLEGGDFVARDALFVELGTEQNASFAEELGCRLDEKGTVTTLAGERSGVEGLFVAGDASEDLKLVAIAVAEGVRAACAINQELREEGRR